MNRRKDDPWLNSYITPGFESLQYLHKLRNQVNEKGGNLEQSYLFIDPDSVAAWLHVARHHDYVSAQDSMPTDQIIDTIYRSLKKTAFDQNSLELLFLGCGDARLENRLLAGFLNRTPLKNLNAYLFDLSGFFLEIAYKNALDLFQDDDRVEIATIHGDFYHLTAYRRLFYRSRVRNQLRFVTLLGTFTNLENEMILLRNSLGALDSGTILLIDITTVYAPADDIDKIHRVDPWLAGISRWQKVEESFLSVPIRRYRAGIHESTPIHFTTKLDNDTSYFPKSYTVEMRAILEPGISFTMQRFKRYEAEPLVDRFSKEGWELISTYPYAGGRRLSCLFQKK